jgi:hypothetical protein
LVEEVGDGSGVEDALAEIFKLGHGQFAEALFNRG